ncbi:YgfZ/GcvT domain-containing protein [Nitratireductor soli]|uniref:CAF17-like 4Fe-4S cluster assembly/insertion protein YgfZ n=1 Tax=Nitratireductor soli TaxID=1670619 RepID=UPI00065DC0CB|nr:folate-binding protein YgfZ [Nitratireductor soli]
MPTCLLDQRALIDVSGPDAEHFLQTIITTDLDQLKPGEARAGALLAPQGKILFDFIVSRAGPEAFNLECRAATAADLLRRLMLYRLRAKLDISLKEQQLVAVSWGDDSASSSDDSNHVDRRFPDAARVVRHYGEAMDANADIAAWDALRIAHAVAESGADFQLGDAFPHDVLYDQNGGLGLKKGCYIGQEVVSRMQHRGTARRRLLIAAGEGVLPAAGSELTASGRALGTLGTVDGPNGLAIARIDRVKDAVDAGTPILAGDVPVTLAIPAWARFTFPESGGDAA